MDENSQPLVSIIVPVYNLEEYIVGTINSILNQDYSNIEVIIVNDGSTDSTGVLCESLKEIDDRVRVFHQENRGVSCARNFGLNCSRGEYIAFVDGDDAIKRNFVSELFRVMRDNDTDVVSCAFECADTIQERDSKASSDNETVSSITVADAQDTIVDLLSHKISPSACERLYRKKAIGNVRFWEGKKYNEDKYFFFQVLQHSNHVAFCGYSGYICLNRATSASRDLHYINFDAIDIAERIIFDFQNNENRLDRLSVAYLNCLLTLLYKARQIVRSKIPKDEKKKLFLIVQTKIRNVPKCKLPLRIRIEKGIINLGWGLYSHLVVLFDALR